ncbi:L-fucose isomerase [bacterium]|nr:L-fucose isomerase [bacterium]
MTEPVQRLRGSLPRIGIRPVIDGRRRGVRESLEGQTMAMARSAADLLTRSLRHSCGLPVECVIAETCIGGAAEAAEAEDLFRRQSVGLSLTVTPCWCYGTEVMDTDPLLPKAVWGFNGTERPGAVYLAAALAGYSQKGLPAFGIYGRHVQDRNDVSIPDDVKQGLLRFAKAGLAVAEMRGKSYLALGGVSMGIAGSIVDEDFFQDWLGMRNISIDMSELIRRMDEGIFDEDEFRLAMRWVKTNCREGRDPNPPKLQHPRGRKNREWEISIKMTLIARDLMVGNPRLGDQGHGEEALGHNAVLAGFQGQRQWTDHFPNGDFMEAVLNASFDWNGRRQPFLMATENDSLNGAAMLFGHLLTDTAQVFADVRTHWSPESMRRVTGRKPSGRAAGGLIHLINSGSAALDGSGRQRLKSRPAIKPFWEISDAEVDACLRAVKWCPANIGYFRGGGFSSQFTTAGDMPVTLSRINLVKGLGPTLQIAEGHTVSLPPDVHRKLDERTDPTWPTTWFAPICADSGAFRDAYSVMSHWGANHGSLCYGHVGDRLITLAAMLRIPVSLHNVPPDRIQRPSAWAAFGADDPQGADFRACRHFGPLYG